MALPIGTNNLANSSGATFLIASTTLPIGLHRHVLNTCDEQTTLLRTSQSSQLIIQQGAKVTDKKEHAHAPIQNT
jgi:hypothetical protein